MEIEPGEFLGSSWSLLSDSHSDLCLSAGVQQGSIHAPHSTLPSHQASSSTSPTFSITSLPQPTVPPPAEEQGRRSQLEEEGGAQKDQSQLKEESVSPVLEMDPSLDMEVMELMSSASPPPSLLHLASPSPRPFPHRGKGRTLRPPPCSSRPSDDLSIRLRQSPFSTEASPETSPTRAPITPPPLSPPSPPLRSFPTVRESAPLSKVRNNRDTFSSLSPNGDCFLLWLTVSSRLSPPRHLLHLCCSSLLKLEWGSQRSPRGSSLLVEQGSNRCDP